MRDEELIERFESEESLYDGLIVHLRKMQVTLPNGKGAVREVVRHIGASAVVPVDGEGNVIMVRQYRAPVGQIMLEIPAGKLDYKDEDRLEAAKRELSEETGFEAAHWVKLTDIITTPGFCDEKISIYLATGLTRGQTHPDDDEFLNIVTLPLEKALEMATSGELTDSKTLCGVLIASNYLNNLQKK